MTDGGVEVAPLRRKDIRVFANRVREVFGIRQPYFQIVEFLDVVLPQIIPDFTLEVLPSDEMGNHHGLTIPDDEVIKIREDVYIGANKGSGRDRMTMAHELGHLLLHKKVQVGLARAQPGLSHQPYRNSEWQAKSFAGELLISSDHLKGCTHPAELELKFGVSAPAAEYQWKIFKKEGLIGK